MLLLRTLPYWLGALGVFAAPLPTKTDILARLPLHFEPKGEQYVTRAHHYNVAVSRAGVVFQFSSGAIEMSWEGAGGATLRPNERQQATSSYFFGSSPSGWRKGVPHYARVRCEGVYDGIDVEFYATGQKVEYDFLIAAGGDPSHIVVRLRGADSLKLDGEGKLVARSKAGDLAFHAPVAYQEIGGKRIPVTSRFALLRGQRFQFQVGDYDRSHPLTIDPVVSFATLLGGAANDVVTAIALDPQQNVYVAGYTQSQNFPVASNAYRTTFGGGEDEIFVAKLSSGGDRLIFSTFLGGQGADRPVGIAVDNLGVITVAGNTSSIDFPRVGITFQDLGLGMFLSRLSADGSQLLTSSYFGGRGSANGNGGGMGTGEGVMTAFTRDASGNLYIGGHTTADSFPVTSGAVQGTKRLQRDGFVAKIASNLSALLYSTLLGGNGNDEIQAIAVDGQGKAYVTGTTTSTDFPISGGAYQTPNRGGSDVFLTCLNGAASAIEFSSLMGGSSDELARSIAFGAGGSIYVAGLTYSNNYPTTAGAYQFLRPAFATAGFVTKLLPNGAGLIYSTYLGAGGTYFDVRGIGRIVTDTADNAYVAGTGFGNGFPMTVGALQSPSPGFQDGFLARLSPNGDLMVYSTYFGGAQDDTLLDMALDATGNVYLAGSTTSSNFPVSSSAIQTAYRGNTDGFVAKIDLVGVATTCSFSLSAANAAFDSIGGSSSFELQTAAGCAWTVTSNQSWALVSNGASGTGTGTISFTVEANATTQSRSAVISAGGQVFTITQTAAPCLFTIDPQNRTVPVSGGVLNFVVSTIPGCAWTMASNTSWLRLAGVTGGNGTGSAPLVVESNATGAPRTGSVTIARQGIHIMQPAAIPTQAFDDVPLSHPFADHIFLMKQNNASDFCNQNPATYCPENITTRAQMAVFIVRALQGGDHFTFPSAPYFVDVPPEHPQFAHIQKLREIGVTNGCSATEFCPGQDVTRGQMAAFIIRAKLRIRAGQAFTHPLTPFFTDVGSSDIFFGHVQKLKELGITSGCTVTEYCPLSLTTRGQMAVFVVRGLFTP